MSGYSLCSCQEFVLLAGRQLRKEMGKERAYTKDPTQNFGLFLKGLVTYVALLLILGRIFSGRKL